MMDPSQYRELEILRHVAETPRLNNRMAARKLGVSVKLAHETLKRMVERGWLHVHKRNSRRWDYFLTPDGLREKGRLTLEFLGFTLQFYRDARRQSAQVCRRLAESGLRQVALLGATELAEIVSLGIREWGLELVAVYDDASSARTFLDVPIRPLSELCSCDASAVIVCMYDESEPMRPRYCPPAVAGASNLVWVFEDDPLTGSAGLAGPDV